MMILGYGQFIEQSSCLANGRCDPANLFNDQWDPTKLAHASISDIYIYTHTFIYKLELFISFLIYVLQVNCSIDLFSTLISIPIYVLQQLISSFYTICSGMRVSIRVCDHAVIYKVIFS